MQASQFTALRKTLETGVTGPGFAPADLGFEHAACGFERTAFGMRITPGEPWHIGWVEFAAPCEHFAVTRIDLTNLSPPPQQKVLDAAAADLMTISLLLEGSVSVGIGGRTTHWRAPCCIVFAAGPEATPLPSAVLTAQRQRSVTIALPRRFLTDAWELDGANLPDLLRRLQDGGGDLNFEILPMTPELAAIAFAIMQCDYSGPLLDKYLESKAHEALCLIVAAAARPADDRVKGLVLTPRDLDRLTAAQAIVAERFAAPPSIAALGREVGLNRNKLCAGFAARFGVTIHAYVRELRLSKALEMLRDDSGSVLEVALAVGYEHASNLSAALKKRYGLSPKQLRTRKRVAV